MTLHIQKLSGPGAIEALAAEWDALDQQLPLRTPFTSPLWAKLWWKHLRRAQNWRRHEFFVHILRDDAGRLVAVVPLVISHIPAYGPLRLRLLQFFGASDGSITEHRRIICRPEAEAEVIQAFTNYLVGLKDNWDLFLWTGIRAPDVGGFKTLKVYRQIPEYVVSLPASWEGFRSNLSRNMKEKIRKSYRLLSRDGHAFVFRAVERPEEIPAAITRFLALHSARAQIDSTSRHRDYFRQASQRAFITDCASSMTQQNQLLVFEIQIGGKVVASRLAFIFGRELYFYYSGFDPSWSKHSVMTTLMCESFKWSIERGLLSANLSTGKDPSKLRWKPCEILFYDAALVSPTLRGRIAFKAVKFVVNPFISALLLLRR
jgi:CelD/BcsL family acetyltransferase involved in cellulose biosynthesis